MNARYTFLLLPLAWLIASCGHTNKLAQYPITGKTAFFRTYAARDAASSFAIIESPSSNTITQVIAAVGSVIISDQSRRKLERAVNADSLAVAVSEGINVATRDYLSFRQVPSIDDNPDIIVETELTDIRLASTSVGLGVQVRGKSRIIDRASGTIVWENAESRTIPLSATYLAPLGGRVISSGVSIFNAVQLLSLSEDEIRQVVHSASIDAGREIGEVLREDIAETHIK